jgi:hypothetical protein
MGRSDAVTEAEFQAKLIKKLRRMFPECVILKNDPGYLQGVPDLVIFYGDRYAFLEVKASEDAPTRPNQPYYVKLLNSMSFAAFIYPSNEQEVLDALRRAFQGI